MRNFVTNASITIRLIISALIFVLSFFLFIFGANLLQDHVSFDPQDFWIGYIGIVAIALALTALFARMFCNTGKTFRAQMITTVLFAITLPLVALIR